MSGAMSVSRKHTRKVGFGPLPSKNADIMNKYTRGGNNYKIDALNQHEFQPYFYIYA